MNVGGYLIYNEELVGIMSSQRKKDTYFTLLNYEYVSLYRDYFYENLPSPRRKLINNYDECLHISSSSHFIDIEIEGPNSKHESN